MTLVAAKEETALYLAEQGFSITAIDISAADIEKLKHFADRKGFSITAEVQDMKHYVFTNKFDLIITHDRLITRIKRNLTGVG